MNTSEVGAPLGNTGQRHRFERRVVPGIAVAVCSGWWFGPNPHPKIRREGNAGVPRQVPAPILCAPSPPPPVLLTSNVRSVSRVRASVVSVSSVSFLCLGFVRVCVSVCACVSVVVVVLS